MEALKTAARHKLHGLRLFALSNLGNTYLDMGWFDKAESYYQEALAMEKRYGRSNVHSSMLVNMAEIKSRKNQKKAALEILKEIAALRKKKYLRRTLSITQYMNVLLRIADYCSEMDRNAEFTEALDEAERVAESIEDEKIRRKYLFKIVLLRAEHLLKENPDFETLRNLITKIDNRTVETEQYFEKFRQYGIISRYYEANGRFEAALNEQMKAVSLFEESFTNIAEKEEQLYYLQEYLGIYDRITRTYHCDKKEPMNSLIASEQARGRVLLRPLFRKIEYSVNEGEDELAGIIRSRLREREAFAAYYFLDDRMLWWVIRKDGPVEYGETDYSLSELEEDVMELRKYLIPGLFYENYKSSRMRDRMINEKSGEMHGKLISPLKMENEDIERIHFIPYAHLFYVPFGLLRDQSGELLSERYEFSLYVNIYHFLESLNPDYEGISSKDVLALGGKEYFHGYADLPDLYGLSDYCEAYRDLFEEIRYFCNEDFVISEIQNSLEEIDVLHLTSHNMVSSREPFDSGLVFSPEREDEEYSAELLTVRKCKDWDMTHCKLVCLAACSAAVGPLFLGEGLLGFSWAFLAAGAPAVITSLWDSRLKTTEILYFNFYVNLFQGKSKSRALIDAQKELRTSYFGKYKDPYYWGSLILYGNPY